MAFNNLFDKIKGYARQNPDKARQALDKVEQTVNSKTGGKYSDKLSKAGDAATKGLGLDQKHQGAPDQVGQQSQPGQTPQQGQTPQAQTPQQGETPQGGQEPGQQN